MLGGSKVLKCYILLYKLTGFCPGSIPIRIYGYMVRRMRKMETPGYYIGLPSQSIELYVLKYETKLGLCRAGTLKEIKRMLKSRSLK